MEVLEKLQLTLEEVQHQVVKVLLVEVELAVCKAQVEVAHLS